MNIKQRIEILIKLKNYIIENNENWQQTKQLATIKNAWFIENFINVAVENICNNFLDEIKLNNWVKKYKIADIENCKNIGVVMAGNIPLVGFHDFLCVFISGYTVSIKLSFKDDVLLKHLVKKMIEWNAEMSNKIFFVDMLKNCDAYIATGSNNSSRYFEYYFGKYPNIIRRNRTSVAILTGEENDDDLNLLAKDIQLYFGQGCRNITHLSVPINYNFVPIINALKQYNYFFDFHKYKNNYDYQLALLMMNNKYYMTDGSVLLSENESVFSAISQVHYSYYNTINVVIEKYKSNNDIQCIIGKGFTDFGKAQEPSLIDYADGIDTMNFLGNLTNN